MWIWLLWFVVVGYLLLFYCRLVVGLAFCFDFVVVIGFVIAVLHFSFFVVYCNVCFVLRCCGVA